MKRSIIAAIILALAFASVPVFGTEAYAGGPETSQALSAVKPAVVGVIAALPATALDPAPRRYGTGFVYKNQVVVTLAGIVQGAKSVYVLLPDKSVLNIDIAKNVFTDSASQVAVILAPQVQAAPASLGDSAGLRVGDSTIVLANPTGAADRLAASFGVVSGMDRQLNAAFGYIQTDAPFMFGSLGAPLVNSKGQVVGMVAAQIHESGLERLNLAIPASEISKAADRMIAEKASKGRPWLGLVVSETRNTALGIRSTDGLVVTRVERTGPASGQIAEGNVITKLNGKPVQTEADYQRILATEGPSITVEFLTGTQLQQTKTVTLRSVPEPANLKARAGIVRNLSLQQYDEALDYAYYMNEESYARFASGYLARTQVAEVLLETEFFRVANAAYLEYRRPSGKTTADFERLLTTVQGKLFVHALLPVQATNQNPVDGPARLIAPSGLAADLKTPVTVVVSQGTKKYFEGAVVTGSSASAPILTTVAPPAPATAWVWVTVAVAVDSLDTTGTLLVDLGKFGSVTFDLSEIR